MIRVYGQQEKMPFSILASGMGWDTRTTRLIKRWLHSAQEIAPYDSFNAWFKERGDQRGYFDESLRFKQMWNDSRKLDGYLGNQYARFLACDLEQ